MIYYYKVTLLKSSAPILTYASSGELQLGLLILVPLKGREQKGVVVASVEQPPFDTHRIIKSLDKHYPQEYMSIATFISQYYFSSLGEALALFLPFTTHRTTHSSAIALHSPMLTLQQQQAYQALLKNDKSLLFGVTGSGKTEIFIALMSQMLLEGKSSIFLMPEISLTPQMEKRLRVYFGDQLAMWHSKITKKKKAQIIDAISSGEVKIVAGARSALFAPLRDIGLIIVDEEHDDSYKSTRRPRYHARDVAILMGDKIDAKVLLASATPSISSYSKYPVVKLDKAYKEQKKSYHFLSGTTLTSQMINLIRKNFERGEQSLLFLPTRGNFKYLYCERCGKTHLCPFCSVGMTLHQYNRHLKCHYCGYSEQIVESCSYCGHHPLKSERMGTVEAMEMIQEQIPAIKIEQFDKDSITSAKRLKDALQRFETQESHLLLGTQMLSKGHDYANITLSIILGLDYILGLADYRAKEKAVSLMVQIAGRSGRAKAATVIIQSNHKEILEPYLDNYEQFILDELAFAKDLYPPFVSLARILIADKNQKKAMDLTEVLLKKLQKFSEIEIVGSGKAPIEKIANKYRYHILLRAKKRTPLLQALHSINQRAIEIDMDPVEFT